MAAKSHISGWLRVVCLRAYECTLVIVHNCIFLSSICLHRKWKRQSLIVIPTSLSSSCSSSPFCSKHADGCASICTCLIRAMCLFTNRTYSRWPLKTQSNEEDTVAGQRWRDRMRGDDVISAICVWVCVCECAVRNVLLADILLPNTDRPSLFNSALWGYWEKSANIWLMDLVYWQICRLTGKTRVWHFSMSIKFCFLFRLSLICFSFRWQTKLM